MFDRVFNDRLQQHVRYCNGHRLRLNAHVDSQPVLEADFFDGQIAFQELQFFLKWNFLGLRLT